MRRYHQILRCAVVVVAICCLLFPLSSFAANVPSAVLKASDSVVYIEAGVGDNAASGSGFVVYKDNEGTYIATNNHVIEDSTGSVYVWISESIRERAEVVAQSESQDLAVLHLSVEMDAKPLTLSAKANQGEEVFAIGFPAGADVLSSTVSHIGSEATITSGIISSIRNSNLIYDTAYIKILQISVDINSGNSGGPLLNSKGEVLGINAFGVIETQGINGAISTEELMSLVKTYNLFEIPNGTSNQFLFVLISLVALAIVVFAWIFLKRINSKKRKPIVLSEYLTTLETPLDCYSAVSLLMPIALSLKSKHDAGTISLHIFPAGIGVTESGCVLLENNDKPTERFLSPEQRKGTFAGIPADIYAFCAVLDYMLEASVQNLEVRGDDAECRELRQIIKRGLSEKASARYSTMQELIFDLAPFNRGISAESLRPFNKKISLTRKSAITSEAKSLISAEEIAIETKTKKRKKKMLAILVSIALIVLFFIGAATFSIVNKNIALEKMDSFEFNQAVEIFDRIPFGNAFFPDEYKYIAAAELVVKKEFDAAKNAFELLGDYRESKPAMREVIYQKGLYEISNGNFTEASDEFSTIKDYRDAETQEQYARYLNASELSEAGQFDESLRLLFDLVHEDYEPAKQLIVDVSLLKAQKLASQESFGVAYETLEKVKDFGDVNAQLIYYRDEAYRKGVSLYHKKSFRDAKSQFKPIGNYQDSEDYLKLINIHLDSTSYFNIDPIVELIGFEDASELLMRDTAVAWEYLLGMWRGDGCYLKIEKRSADYSLPHFYYGDYIRIENGMFLLYPAKKPSSTKKLFQISVLSKDCIQVFAYQNSRYYILFRN